MGKLLASAQQEEENAPQGLNTLFRHSAEARLLFVVEWLVDLVVEHRVIEPGHWRAGSFAAHFWVEAGC